VSESTASFTPLGELRTCSGRAVTFAGETVPGAGVPELALASLLAEREATGEPVRVVMLRLGERDQAWVPPTVSWLASRGRRVVLRAATTLTRPTIASARRHGATVALELAHPVGAVQQALLGPHAEPMSVLLLHAQHLRACDLEVAAWLGPLLPSVADDRTLTTMAQHVAAADLVDAHAVIGRLGPSRLEALTRVLPWPQVAAMARAYGIDPSQPSALPANGVWLSPMADAALRHAIRREAEAHGLRLDHCGCAAQCHLDGEQRSAFVTLGTPELFPVG
jgi:hypothetical protein